jgi:hypothetical protein
MLKQLLCPGSSFFGVALLSGLAGLAACSSKSGESAKDSGSDAKTSHPEGGSSGKDAGCQNGDPGATYVLIDDMETTSHGPIEFDTGIAPPLTGGYWYNSGANYWPDAGIDMSTPPQMSFVFTELPTPTKTLNCKVSTHAARQSCELNGLYDTCGVGFEFAQEPDDAGVAPTNTGMDAGPPKTTVPFDISRYKAFTFWGMTTTPDPILGYLQVKVQLPDTDTDPRGEVCNGGGGNTSKCYNSYASNLKFTTSWQQYTVLLDAGGDAGVAPEGGIAIDPSWGYQQAKWIPTQVYGINWQAQRNAPPDAGPALATDIWVDDVFFVE